MDAGDIYDLKEASGDCRKERKLVVMPNRIQNDIIGIIGSYIQNHLVENILHQLVSILADEATDVSSKEQLPLVLRYVDPSGEIGKSSLDILLLLWRGDW